MSAYPTSALPPHMQHRDSHGGPSTPGGPGAGAPQTPGGTGQVQPGTPLSGMKRKADEMVEPRKQRPPLPPPYLLASLVPDSKMFADLLKMEQKLDWTMLRKRAEVNDALGRPVKVKRTLRIYLSNTAHNQPWQLAPATNANTNANSNPSADSIAGAEGVDVSMSDGVTGGVASASGSAPADGNGNGSANGNGVKVNVETGEGVPGWTMRVEGRLLDTGNARIDKLAKRKFSQLVKTIVVEMDDRPVDVYGGESNIVEWHAAAHPGSASTNHLDGFEIRRRGDSDVHTRIILHLNHYPERYKVLSPLADLIAVREDSRAGIMASVWKWIKSVGAQDRDDPTKVLLRGGVEKFIPPQPSGSVPFHRLPEFVNQYLAHPDPVLLEFDVRVDKDRHVHPTVYDITIEIEDPQKSKMHAAVAMLEGTTPPVGGLTSGSVVTPANATVKEVMAVEDEVAVLAMEIRTAKGKRDFLQAFASNPHDFIHRWLSSQARDLDAILGNEIGVLGTNGGRVREEDLRRSDLFRLPWVEEAVTIREGMRQLDVQQRQEEERRRMAQRQQQQQQQQQQQAQHRPVGNVQGQGYGHHGSGVGTPGGGR